MTTFQINYVNGQFTITADGYSRTTTLPEICEIDLNEWLNSIKRLE